MNDILLLFRDSKFKIIGLSCYVYLWLIGLINMWEKLRKKNVDEIL